MSLGELFRVYSKRNGTPGSPGLLSYSSPTVYYDSNTRHFMASSPVVLPLQEQEELIIELADERKTSADLQADLKDQKQQTLRALEEVKQRTQLLEEIASKGEKMHEDLRSRDITIAELKSKLLQVLPLKLKIAEVEARNRHAHDQLNQTISDLKLLSQSHMSTKERLEICENQLEDSRIEVFSLQQRAGFLKRTTKEEFEEELKIAKARERAVVQAHHQMRQEREAKEGLDMLLKRLQVDLDRSRKEADLYRDECLRLREDEAPRKSPPVPENPSVFNLGHLCLPFELDVNLSTIGEFPCIASAEPTSNYGALFDDEDC